MLYFIIVFVFLSLYAVLSQRYFHYAFFFLIFYFPFQIALNPPIAGIDIATGRLMIIILFFVCCVKFFNLVGESRARLSAIIRNDKIGRLLLAFLFFSALSVLWSENWFWGLRKWLVFASIFPFYWITLYALFIESDNGKYSLRTAITPMRVVFFMSLSAFLTAISALVQFIGQFIWGGDRVFHFWAKKFFPVFLGQEFGATVFRYQSWFVDISGKTIMRAVGFFPDPHALGFYIGLTAPLVFSGIFYFWPKNKIIPLCPKTSWSCRGDEGERGMSRSLPQGDEGMKTAATGDEERKIFRYPATLPRGGFIYWIGVLCLLAAVVLTFSRSAYLGLIAGILSFLILWFKSEAKKRRICALVLITILLIGVLFPPVYNRFYSSFNAEEISNAGRLKNWQEALSVIEKYPIYGSGIGSYQLNIDNKEDELRNLTNQSGFSGAVAGLFYDNDMDNFFGNNYRSPIYAHNTYLDIWAELGIIGLFLWLGIFFIVFFGNFKILVNRFAAGDTNFIYIIGITAALIWFIVQSFFDTVIYSPVVLPTLMIVLAINAFLTLKEKQRV